MRKKYVLLMSVFALLATSVYAQVGVNTETPRATLDVMTRSGYNAEGIIAPQMLVADLYQRHDRGVYGADQNGAIVYVTSAPGKAGPTENIKKIGYYYYDAPTDRWMPFGSGSGGGIWYRVTTTEPSEKNTDDSYLSARAVVGGDKIQK